LAHILVQQIFDICVLALIGFFSATAFAYTAERDRYTI